MTDETRTTVSVTKIAYNVAIRFWLSPSTASGSVAAYRSAWAPLPPRSAARRLRLAGPAVAVAHRAVPESPRLLDDVLLPAIPRLRRPGLGLVALASAHDLCEVPATDLRRARRGRRGRAAAVVGAVAAVAPVGARRAAVVAVVVRACGQRRALSVKPASMLLAHAASSPLGPQMLQRP